MASQRKGGSTKSRRSKLTRTSGPWRRSQAKLNLTPRMIGKSRRTPRQPVIRVAKLLRRQPPTPRPHALKQPVAVTQMPDDFAREAQLATMCECGQVQCVQLKTIMNHGFGRHW